MAAEERWYFTKEELNNSPSRRCGIDAEKELSYRQQGANLIQDMGQRLQVNQLAINTAIVYMHRFYMFHPFTRFHRNAIAPAALFLAAKVEEQPRKLEHVIKVAYHCLFRDQPPLDTQSEGYLERAQELVVNENILLQTLGFDVAIDHPHTHVVKCCHLVRATKDLAQTSYFMATSSLHMTTMCLQYKPTVVACVCIYIVCTWSHYEIQRATEGKDWFWYVDKTVTLELLETLTAEFLAILDKCPNRLKKIMNSLQHTEDRGRTNQAGSSSTTAPLRSTIPGSAQASTTSAHVHESHNSHSKTAIKVPPAQAHQHQQPSKLNLKEYNKREKERREREKMRDRDVLDPRESNKFALVSTSHSSQSVASAVATIASSHAAMHSGLPVRSKSSGRGSSHPEHLKASSVHTSNHKTHGHTASQVVRDSQPSLESLRVSTETPRQEQQLQQQQQQHQQQQVPPQRRDPSARSDSERYDKGSRTSSSAVDGRLQGDVKPSVSDIRQQQLLDVKPSRQLLESVSIERKKEIKLEQKSVERKPPEPKPEQSKVKMEIKTEPKEEVKSQYNTIFHNSDLPEFALSDFMNDNTFLNLSEGPPDQLFDNSDTETKPDISAIIEDNSLLPPPSQQKSKSPVSSQQQQVPAPQTQHQHASNSVTTNASSAGGNSELRVSENASTTAGANHHSVRHHGTTNGSVAPSQPTHPTPQTSKSSSSKRAREAEKKSSERASTEAELVPMVTKLEDTRYRTALSDPATPIKLRTDAANAAAANTPLKPPAAPPLATPSVPVEVPQKPPIEPVLRLKVPQPDHPKEPQPDPAVPVAVSGALITEHKKHKNEHPHHKHKEKKKHKHKEKDKHKEKEHKEHKEHKEKKKHKKHKDKDKDRDKASRAAAAAAAGDGGTAPIKITIPKDKILYTPKNASVPLRTHAATAPAAPITIPTSISNTSTTPSIPKFKIDKSKLNKKDLFGGTSSTSPESSPAGDLARDTPTTSLKIKISRDRLRPDKESKKRDRDHSPGEVPVAKLPRNGNEVRSSHAAPQVGSGHPQPPHNVGISHPSNPQQHPRKPFPHHHRGRGSHQPQYLPRHTQPVGMMPMLQPTPNPYPQFYPYPIPPPNFSYPPPPYLPHLHSSAPLPYIQGPPPPPPPPPPPQPPPVYIPQQPMPPPTLPSDPPLPSEPPPPTPPPPPPPE